MDVAVIVLTLEGAPTDVVPRATSLFTISLSVSPWAVLKSKLVPRAAGCRLLVYTVS